MNANVDAVRGTNTPSRVCCSFVTIVGYGVLIQGGADIFVAPKAGEAVLLHGELGDDVEGVDDAEDVIVKRVLGSFDGSGVDVGPLRRLKGIGIDVADEGIGLLWGDGGVLERGLFHGINCVVRMEQ